VNTTAPVTRTLGFVTTCIAFAVVAAIVFGLL